jgi:hypothetical protein
MNTVDDGVLELLVDRITAAATVYVDGQPATILSRSSARISIRMENAQTYPCRVSVREGERWSERFTVTKRPQLVADANYHRVVEASIDIYSDAAATQLIAGTWAVALESNEGGRAFVRYFPTDVKFQAGQFVELDFDTSRTCHAAWLKEAGRVVEAWSGSTYVGGKVHGGTGPAVLERLELRPPNRSPSGRRGVADARPRVLPRRVGDAARGHHGIRRPHHRGLGCRRTGPRSARRSQDWFNYGSRTVQGSILRGDG